jgi:hypothetical protein
MGANRPFKPRTGSLSSVKIGFWRFVMADLNSLSSADEGIVLRALSAAEARRLRPDLPRMQWFRLAGSRAEWQPGRPAETGYSTRSR